jgi:hypothetical protein
MMGGQDECGLRAGGMGQGFHIGFAWSRLSVVAVGDSGHYYISLLYMARRSLSDGGQAAHAWPVPNGK